MKQALIIVCIFFCSTIHAQLTLSGKIISESNLPLSKAVVTAKQKTTIKNTLADDNGTYTITGLAAGSWQVTVAVLGYEASGETIVLNKGLRQLNFVLSASIKELQTVEVTGRSAKKYNSDYSFSATKTAMLTRDIPQSIATVTKELIADRQAFQLADAVKIIPGVIPASFYNQYTIRGISQNEEGQIINGMRTRQHYFLQPLTTHIERVEVIKGPASATLASVDPGGSINLVTKKPLSVNRKEISFSAGSFSTIRGTLDFTGPLNEDKTLLYRLNGAYQEAKSYRDLVRNHSMLISPSLSYIPNHKTALNVEMILSNMVGNLDRGQPIFGAVAGAALNSTPISLNLGASNDFFKSKEFILTSSLSHKFTNTISLNAAYMKQTWQEDLQEHRTDNSFAPDINNQLINSMVGMQFIQRRQNWDIDNATIYFNFEFSGRNMHHQLLVGYDISSWKKLKGSGQNRARGFLLKDGTVANSFEAVNAANYQTILYNGRTMPKPIVNHFDLSSPSYTIRNINDYIITERRAIPSALTTNNAIYIQEQIKWKKLSLLVSLRNEWFKDITNHESFNELSFTNIKLLPRIGLTYAATKQINFYGTYLEGYQPQSNTVTLMLNTGTYFWTSQSAARFKPLISNLTELGVKATVWKGKLHVNAAVYTINQQNLLLKANIPAFPDSLVTRGAEKSNGFEIDMAGYLMPNWQINASYSYIDAIIVEDKDPALKGARKQNTPYTSANVWTRYNFAHGTKLKDIGIGLGIQYNGDRIPWYTRAFTTPAYTLYDLAFYYTPGKSNMQLALNINNVLNTTHWIGAQNYTRLFPGSPRSLMLTATYKF